MHIIGGKYKKRPLVAPKTDLVRPTTSQLRESVFNICQNRVEESRFLDLFAGSGAMGLEALSRGARSATFVENNRLAIKAIKTNIETLKVEKKTRVLFLSVMDALKRIHDWGETFELIYADPPYGENLSTALLDFLDQYRVLTDDGSLFIEDTRLQEPTMKNLKLYDKRRVGSAYLYEYRFAAGII